MVHSANAVSPADPVFGDWLEVEAPPEPVGHYFLPGSPRSLCSQAPRPAVGVVVSAMTDVRNRGKTPYRPYCRDCVRANVRRWCGREAAPPIREAADRS